MPVIDYDTSAVPTTDPTHISRATYFMLEAYTEFGDNYHLARIEDAEEEGGFALHVGFPDRPAERYAEHFRNFEEALDRLTDLKTTHPTAGMWLSTLELRTEIEGEDIWCGAVRARASFAPTYGECPWNMFAAAIAEADAAGQPFELPDDEDLPSVFEDIAAHL